MEFTEKLLRCPGLSERQKVALRSLSDDVLFLNVGSGEPFRYIHLNLLHGLPLALSTVDDGCEWMGGRPWLGLVRDPNEKDAWRPFITMSSFMRALSDRVRDHAFCKYGYVPSKAICVSQSILFRLPQLEGQVCAGMKVEDVAKIRLLFDVLNGCVADACEPLPDEVKRQMGGAELCRYIRTSFRWWCEVDPALCRMLTVIDERPPRLAPPAAEALLIFQDSFMTGDVEGMKEALAGLLPFAAPRKASGGGGFTLSRLFKLLPFLLLLVAGGTGLAMSSPSASFSPSFPVNELGPAGVSLQPGDFSLLRQTLPFQQSWARAGEYISPSINPPTVSLPRPAMSPALLASASLPPSIQFFTDPRPKYAAPAQFVAQVIQQVFSLLPAGPKQFQEERGLLVSVRGGFPAAYDERATGLASQDEPYLNINIDALSTSAEPYRELQHTTVHEFAHTFLYSLNQELPDFDHDEFSGVPPPDDFAHLSLQHRSAVLDDGKDRLGFIEALLNEAQTGTGEAVKILPLALRGYVARLFAQWGSDPVNPFAWTYANTNYDEYWAEAVSAFMGASMNVDFRLNPINAEWLQANDPHLFRLLRLVFGDPQRYATAFTALRTGE